MRSYKVALVALVVLVALLVACAPLGPQVDRDPFLGRGGRDGGCAEVEAYNGRFATAVVYDRGRRVATVEGKMGAEFVLCRPGRPRLSVHFIGGGNLLPQHDGSVGDIGLVSQNLVLVIGLTDPQSHVRARE